MNRQRLVPLICGLTVLAALVAAAASIAKPPVDRDFGASGRVQTNLGAAGLANVQGSIVDVQVDTAARTVVGGGASTLGAPFSVARLRSDGALDRSFAGDGIIEADGEGAFDLTRSGAPVIATGSDRVNDGVVVRRFGEDGSPLRSFGSHGEVRHFFVGYTARVAGVFFTAGGRVLLLVNGVCRPSPGGCSSTQRNAFSVLFSASGRRLRSVRLPVESLTYVNEGPDGTFTASARTSDNEIALELRLDAEGRVTERIDADLLGFGKFDRQPNGQIVVPFGPFAGGRFGRLAADDRSYDAGFDQSAPCQQYGIDFRAVEADPSGRIYGVGSCGLVRLGPNGGADPTFSGDGLVEYRAGDSSAVEPAGAGVVAGAWDTQLGGFRLERFGGDGAPDTGFSGDGTAEIPLTVPTIDEANAIKAEAGGRIVAAGTVGCPGGTCFGFAVSRYGQDGRLDRSFGENGRVLTTDRGLGGATAVTVQPDRKILVAGSTLDATPFGEPEAFALARYLPSGRLDPTFGDRGIVTLEAATAGSGRSGITAIGLQRDGRIVVAGRANGCSEDCATIARFRSNGVLDPSFGDGGLVRVDVPGTRGDYLEALTLAPRGKILVAGGGYGSYVSIRLRRNGTLDPAFGGDGFVITPIRTTFRQGGGSTLTDFSQTARSVIVDRGGRVTVAGGSSRYSFGIVMRYTASGKPDGTFGKKGAAYVPDLGITEIRRAACGYVVSGTAVGEGSPFMGVAGLTSRGRPISGAQITAPFGRSRVSFGNAMVRVSRRMIVAGRVNPRANSGDFALAAVRADKRAHCGR